EVKAKDYLNHKKVYKFVERKDDSLVSFFSNSFEYTIGEIVSTTKSNGLYFNTLENIRQSQYCSDKKGVLIEMEVEFEDLVGINGSELSYSKGIVMREVPKEEYQKFL